MNTSITNFFREEEGVTALEYGLLAAIVAGLLVTVFKTGISDVFNDVVAALKAAVASTTSSS